MDYGDLIHFGVVAIPVVSFWFRTRWRLTDAHPDDASLDRAWARDVDGHSSTGDGGSDGWT